jgi:NitT/TauT family transport system permease protein
MSSIFKKNRTGIKVELLSSKNDYKSKSSGKQHSIFYNHEGTLFFVGAIILWHIVSTSRILPNSQLFPTPLIAIRTLWDSLPELGLGTWSSFLVLFPSYILAVVSGIFTGIIVGVSPFLRRMFFPFARVVAPVPPTIYIPYAIAILPTFYLSSSFVIFIGAFWPVFINASAGAASTPLRYLDNSMILGLSYFDYLRKIVLPASLPHIFNGMTIGLALSFIMLTVAELFGATTGLGRFVQYYADFADYNRMVAGIVYTGLIALLSMELLEYLKQKLLFWNK